MPRRTSAGLLLYRRSAGLQVLLGHMGGPYWARKDAGAWSIPKGEYDAASEESLAAARREFAEELGAPAPDVDYADLGEITLSGGKRLAVWAAEAGFDADAARSNTFALEWPPKSGRIQEFPEIDRAAWFDVPAAREKLTKGQRPLLDRLTEYLSRG